MREVCSTARAVPIGDREVVAAHRELSVAGTLEEGTALGGSLGPESPLRQDGTEHGASEPYRHRETAPY